MKQSGMVLVSALVFMSVIVTMAVVLLATSSTDVKLSTVSMDRSQADAEAEGALDEVIINAQNKAGGVNSFTLPQAVFPDTGMVMAVTATDTDARLFYHTSGPCPRGSGWDSGMNCNYIRIEVDKGFGVKKSGQVVLQQGIAQQYLEGAQ